MKCYFFFGYLLSYQTAPINGFLENNIIYPTKQNFIFSLLEARTTDSKGDPARNATTDTARKWKTNSRLHQHEKHF